MSDKNTFNDLWAKISGYFTRNELIIILILAVLAYLTSTYGLNYVLPGGPGPGFVHGFLKLPGPGTGIFNVSAFICLWLVLGLLVIKKPGYCALYSGSDHDLRACICACHGRAPWRICSSDRYYFKWGVGRAGCSGRRRISRDRNLFGSTDR